jgi:RNA polymerase sigma-70 factor (ECF subfamily)
VDGVAVAVVAVVAARRPPVAKNLARTRRNRNPVGRVAESMNQTAITTEDIWRLLRDRLTAFLRSRTAGQADVEDLLQEVFLRVHRRLATIRKPDRIESWVFQIARNVVADFYRRSAAQPVPLAIDGDVTDPQEKDSLPYQARVARWLALMIELLPSDQREALAMFEMENLSQREIADRLGVSLSAAKSRIARGRKRLADLLGECCRLQFDRRGNLIDCQPRTAEGCLVETCACHD